MIIFLLYLGRSLKMVIVFKNLKIWKPHLAILLAMHVTTCYTSRRLSLATVTALGKVTEKVTDFVFDAAVSTALIITSVRIRNKLSAVSNSKTSKASSPDDSSCKSRTSEGNGCHTNVYTTVYVNQINVTNTTNITINSADSPHKEDVRFSENNHTETSREPLSEDTVAASGSSVSQDSETMSPQSSGNPASGGGFFGQTTTR